VIANNLQNQKINQSIKTRNDIVYPAKINANTQQPNQSNAIVKGKGVIVQQNFMSTEFKNHI